MAAGTQGWNVNSAKDRQDLRRGICKLHRWYVATPSDCPREGGGGGGEEKGRKERKEKKKEHFPKFEGRWKRGQLAVLVNNGVSR